QPSAEICNGLDDDCDGLVDERETYGTCTVHPVPLSDSVTQDFFTVTCLRRPSCTLPVSSQPEPIGAVWLSAADLLSDPDDTGALPEPAAHCEASIVENPARRVDTGGTVTFFLDPSGDGVCGTNGGGSAGLVRALADIPDGLLARVCVKWSPAGTVDVERC